MDGYEPHYDDNFEYRPKRTSPLAKLFVVAGAGVLVFVSGNLAKDILNPDDSGLMPPPAALSVNTGSRTAPIARAPQPGPSDVMKTASISSAPGSTAAPNNGFGIPAPQQLNLQALPIPKALPGMAALPGQPTEQATERMPEETQEPVAEPMPEPAATVDEANSAEQEVLQIHVQSAATPADITAKKVGAFTRQWAGTTEKTKMRKYARTTSVLDQCGLLHFRTLKIYEGNNKPVYKQVEQQRAAKLARSSNRGQSSSSVGAINPSDFTLNMKEGTHNPNLTTFARGEKMNQTTTDDPYPEDLDKEVCKILDAQVKDGLFDIKL